MHSRLFVIPLDDAKVGKIYPLLSYIMGKIDCIALAFENFFHEETYLSIIERLSERYVYGNEFVDDLLSTIPKSGYIQPSKIMVKCCRIYDWPATEIGVARKLNESNIWLLSASLFSNSSACLLPAGIAECELDEIARDFAFMVGFGNVFVERLIRGQARIDFAMTNVTSKTEVDYMALWGGNTAVVKMLNDACRRTKVKALDSINLL